MDQVNVLVVASVRNADMEKIAAVDPRVVVLDGRDKFYAEYRRTWPARMIVRHNYPAESETDSKAAQEERDALLRQADVICVAMPFPVDMVERAPHLEWVHQTPAGASNLRFGDVWGSSVIVTTSRGYGSNTPHAEWVLATMLMFAKDMPRSFADKQSGKYAARQYRMRLLAGKTVGIVGLGGIGRETARLAKAVGMHVIATRRSASTRIANVDGVDELFPLNELPLLLAASDYVVVSAQSTTESARLIGKNELKAMKPTAYIINLARGEIIDQAALIEALRDGTIAGAGLDVYEDEYETLPQPELTSLPNVIYTPHVSGGSDVPVHGGIDLFCENLKRFLSGDELINVVEWERGY